MSVHSPHVLNTRPTGQHLPFTRSLQALGLKVSHLPCLSIQCLPGNPLQDDPANRFDVVLFTSTNAVRCAQALRPLPWTGVGVHAIGAATATALRSLDQPLAMEPQAPFNSEAYLSQLRQYKPASLLLVKGQGGRDLIAGELRSLGWNVSSMDVYRRELPVIDAREKQRIFGHAPPDIISITSNESLNNLVTLAGTHLPLLLNITLVVNSQRTAEHARTLGFKEPALVADSAGDQGQLQVIEQWFRMQQRAL